MSGGHQTEGMEKFGMHGHREMDLVHALQLKNARKVLDTVRIATTRAVVVDCGR
jgi:hypothetical protein